MAALLLQCWLVRRYEDELKLLLFSRELAGRLGPADALLGALVANPATAALVGFAAACIVLSSAVPAGYVAWRPPRRRTPSP